MRMQGFKINEGRRNKDKRRKRSKRKRQGETQRVKPANICTSITERQSRMQTVTHTHVHTLVLAYVPCMRSDAVTSDEVLQLHYYREEEPPQFSPRVAWGGGVVEGGNPPQMPPKMQVWNQNKFTICPETSVAASE